MSLSSRSVPPLAGGGRVAILGSCVTRDLWRMTGAAADDLLYISRTRLPSLFAPRLRGLVLHEGPPPGLRPNPAQALRADLAKTALARLVAFRPDVVILDYIDERFDLLVGAGGAVTASWELETSGWDALLPMEALRRLDALAPARWAGHRAQGAALGSQQRAHRRCYPRPRRRLRRRRHGPRDSGIRHQQRPRTSRHGQQRQAGPLCT